MAAKVQQNLRICKFCVEKVFRVLKVLRIRGYMGTFTITLTMLVYAVGYSWDIRGVFTEYSWDIRMCRVCIGYVSGMCRECIETS